MKFVIKSSADGGLKIYGDSASKKGELLVRDDYVINGAWDIVWTDGTQNRGYCDESADRYFFDYLCHVEDVVRGQNYNDILNEYSNSISVVQP